MSSSWHWYLFYAAALAYVNYENEAPPLVQMHGIMPPTQMSPHKVGRHKRQELNAVVSAGDSASVRRHLCIGVSLGQLYWIRL